MSREAIEGSILAEHVTGWAHLVIVDERVSTVGFIIEVMLQVAPPAFKVVAGDSIM